MRQVAANVANAADEVGAADVADAAVIVRGAVANARPVVASVTGAQVSAKRVATNATVVVHREATTTVAAGATGAMAATSVVSALIRPRAHRPMPVVCKRDPKHVLKARARHAAASARRANSGPHPT